MKKSNIIYIILIISALLVIISACSKKNPKPNESVKDPDKPIEDIVEEKPNKEKIMKEFNNIVESKNPPDKVIPYIDEYISKLTDIEGDHMISKLEKVLEKFLESTTDDLFEIDQNYELINLAGDELFFPKEKIQDIKSEELRDEVIRIMDNKYKLINLEGNYYPIIDYEKLQEYNEYISTELKDYLEIKVMESDKPMAIDAGLFISYDELAERILKIEEYIKHYSGGQRFEEMLKNYRIKLAIYLSGIDNSPISDYETGKIYDDVLESYKKTSNTKDTITGFIVTKHLKSIEEAEYIVDEKVKDSVLSLVNEALSLLEITK